MVSQVFLLHLSNSEPGPPSSHSPLSAKSTNPNPTPPNAISTICMTQIFSQIISGKEGEGILGGGEGGRKGGGEGGRKGGGDGGKRGAPLPSCRRVDAATDVAESGYPRLMLKGEQSQKRSISFGIRRRK